MADATSKSRFYNMHVESLTKRFAEIPAGLIADRFHAALTLTLEELAPARESAADAFAGAMRDAADESPISGEPARRLAEAYRSLAVTSDDAPREPLATQLGIVLCLVHMLIALHWLYDRTPGQARTRQLVDYASELFRLLRPMFFLPMITGGIARLAAIVMPEALPGAAAQNDAGDGQHQNLDVHGQ